MGPKAKTEPSARMTENRDVLVQAARTRLLSDGLAGLRFERIAETAGMTRKSVYNHFGSRQGLIEALMDDIGRRAGFQGMAEVFQTPQPAALVAAFFTELCRGWQADRDMFRLMIGLSAADPELGAAIQARVGRVRGGVTGLAQRLGHTPGLRDGWSQHEAEACLFGLAVFTTYDAMRSAGMDHTVVALRLAECAKAPFRFD